MSKRLKAAPRKKILTKRPKPININKNYTPPDTVVDGDQLTTVMPNGLRIGWSRCGGCRNEFHHCKCVGGVRAQRSVEYIYDRIVAEMAGEEWSIWHPNYRGSFTRKDRERAQQKWEARITRGVAPIRPTKPAEPTKKRLRKASERVDLDNLDMGALDKAAKKSADKATKQLRRLVKSTGPKRLKKR